ncbi:hypothetical protein DPMN_043836 [Dreissena polymorpha]|uniref:Uncharacterized protein n=1 Tax=Dreissena polymorpha TaxID=45954 RepID=A0A9D4D4R7_DREPO|nr:hypothetical protein DPMN_043836 [Dreissena polymorpha]
MTSIFQLTDTQTPNLQKLSVKLETVMGEIASLKSSQEARAQALQGKHTKQSINDCIISSIHKYTILQNDLTLFYETIKKTGDNKELSFIASIKCEHKIQQALIGLGKSGNVFTVKGKFRYNARIQSDSHKCDILGTCVVPDGQVLVADKNNRKVKLLDQLYQVVSHWSATDIPWDICLITPSEVAVVVMSNVWSNTGAVQFITVNQNKLVPGKKHHLPHEC